MKRRPSQLKTQLKFLGILVKTKKTRFFGMSKRAVHLGGLGFPGLPCPIYAKYTLYGIAQIARAG